MWQGTKSRHMFIIWVLFFVLIKNAFFFLLICFVKSASFIGWRNAYLKHSLSQSTIRGCRCSLWELLHLCHCGHRFRKHYLFPFRDHIFPTASRTQTHTYLITNLILLPACLFHILYDTAHVWTSDPMKTGCRLSIAFLVMCLNLPHVGRCTSVAVKFTFSILCYTLCLLHTVYWPFIDLAEFW